MLEIIVEDSKCAAQDAITAYRKLTDVDEVKIILGTSCSGAMLGAAPLAEEDGVIMFSGLATNSDIAEAGDYIFRTALSDLQLGIDTGNVMWADGARKLATITEATDYADGVGMGKTEIGVQFVREHTRDLGQHVLVISPAQLRDHLWQQRLSEENLPGTVVSYQQLAQDRQLSPSSNRRVLPVNKDVYRFVIIDEAHAYRNVDNTWYAALDRLMGARRRNCCC